LQNVKDVYITHHRNPYQNYGASPAVWHHSVTCHPTHTNMHGPFLSPPRQAGTPFTCPRGMEDWVHLLFNSPQNRRTSGVWA